MIYTRLGDILIKNGTITQSQLEEALAVQKGSGQRLGTLLQEHGIITEKQLIEALMTQLGLEFIDLNDYQISPEMAQLLPKSIAKKYTVVPVRATRNDIYLAMADPLNFVASEEVRAATCRHVIPMIATQAAAERAIANLYGSQGTMRAIEDMRRDLTGEQYALSIPSVGTQQLSVGEEDLDAAPAIRLVNSIIERA